MCSPGRTSVRFYPITRWTSWSTPMVSCQPRIPVIISSVPFIVRGVPLFGLVTNKDVYLNDLIFWLPGVRLIRFNVKATEAKLTTESPTDIKVTQDNNTTEAEHQVDVELSGKTGWLGYDDEFWLILTGLLLKSNLWCWIYQKTTETQLFKTLSSTCMTICIDYY